MLDYAFVYVCRLCDLESQLSYPYVVVVIGYYCDAIHSRFNGYARQIGANESSFCIKTKTMLEPSICLQYDTLED